MLVGWLCLRPIDSKSFRHGTPIYCPVKLGKYTVPTGNRTPGRFTMLYNIFMYNKNIVLIMHLVTQVSLVYYIWNLFMVMKIFI